MATYTISQLTMPTGDVIILKDSEARLAAAGGIHLIGEVASGIVDGAATPTSVTLVGEEDAHTMVANEAVFMGSKEFVWTGSKWIEWGDRTGLGELATEDVAVGVFTPQGSVSKPDITVTPTTATVKVGDSDGSVVAGTAASMTLPSWGATVSGENLIFNWNAGSFTTNTPTAVVLPTTKNQSVMTGATAALDNAPVFSGTQGNITVGKAQSGTP